MLGLIGKKIGMTQVFDEKGILTPVTVIKIEDNFVVDHRTCDKNGYDACVLGAVDKKKTRVTKTYAGQFPEGIVPKRYLVEMRDFDQECQVGDKLGAETFSEVDYVDVIGTTKGKGYQGVMRRHGFSGGGKTHGSKFHRANGSTGQASYPSRVFKGLKMPGRMGNARSTMQNLKVVKVDPEQGVLLVRGAVPGTRDSMVVVRKAIKR